jgi:hypothetical protein
MKGADRGKRPTRYSKVAARMVSSTKAQVNGSAGGDRSFIAGIHLNTLVRPTLNFNRRATAIRR